MQENIYQFYYKATALSVITIIYNLAEGLLSVYFGYEDETLALFGFGIDSFVEVISAVGILHMVMRLRRLKVYDIDMADRFESTALKITGSAFYILALSLIFTASVSLSIDHHPETTLWGIIVSLVSISVMWLLIRFKVKVAKQYNSHALLADAECSKACMYLSVVLLIASLGYETTGIGGFDAIGAIGIALFAFKEGKEAFAKAKNKLNCYCNCSSTKNTEGKSCQTN